MAKPCANCLKKGTSPWLMLKKPINSPPCPGLAGVIPAVPPPCPAVVATHVNRSSLSLVPPVCCHI